MDYMNIGGLPPRGSRKMISRNSHVIYGQGYRAHNFLHKEWKRIWKLMSMENYADKQIENKIDTGIL